MQKFDMSRVTYYSRQDMAWGHQLSKGEKKLREQTKSSYDDINDILELYNISRYLANGQYLNSWSEDDITIFSEKGKDFGKIVGSFFSKITDSNIQAFYEELINNYAKSFWEIINNQKVYKKIATGTFESILEQHPTQLRLFLKFKELVAHYKVPLRAFFLSHNDSAEILLAHYEANNDKDISGEIYLPPNLTIDDKETIISNYVAGETCNLNYLRLIRYSKKQKDFIISDKTKLSAKRREKLETDKIFDKTENASLQRYGVSISFSESQLEPADCSINGLDISYSYGVNYIRKNCDCRALFTNFATLFNFTDEYGRINLVNKKSERSTLESLMGISSISEYPRGIAFQMSEMTSHAQTLSYWQVLLGLDKPLEDILKFNFTEALNKKYNFPKNAQLSMPSSTLSYFEKVVLLAPKFERVLKQYKLFVEEGEIDFELLQISSSPSSIKDIPSLIDRKYFYINTSNNIILVCSNIFFSDQFSLAYVEPFIEKKYKNFFDLLSKEDVNVEIYEEWQRPEINYLIDHDLIYIDHKNFIQIKNFERVYILKDLRENEVAVYAHYPERFQHEALQMEKENLIEFESSLFSRPEQSYFNYYLNKSEFTNGFDLRNSYLHGTQPNPDEVKIHEQSYFSYLKLLVLVLLKIDNDLFLANMIKSNSDKL